MQPRFAIAAALACLALAGCSTVQPISQPLPAWAHQHPKSHGAIHRFFHPKSERGVLPRVLPRFHGHLQEGRFRP